jgi:hypothetical protein
MKIIDYILASGAYPSDLIIEVRKLIKEGWQPIGGSYIRVFSGYDGVEFYQAMVKYEASPPVVVVDNVMTTLKDASANTTPLSSGLDSAIRREWDTPEEDRAWKDL